MPELSAAARGGGEHRHPPVRRWWCAHPGCDAHGVGGWAQLDAHHRQAHPRCKDDGDE